MFVQKKNNTCIFTNSHSWPVIGNIRMSWLINLSLVGYVNMGANTYRPREIQFDEIPLTLVVLIYQESHIYWQFYIIPIVAS